VLAGYKSRVKYAEHRAESSRACPCEMSFIHDTRGDSSLFYPIILVSPLLKRTQCCHARPEQTSIKTPRPV
jgi:hypothetical protein